MAGVPADLPAGVRVSDHISVGVIAKAFLPERVQRVLAETGKASERERDLPAQVMVYYAIALALYMSSSTREVLRCLLERLLWLWGAEAEQGAVVWHRAYGPTMNGLLGAPDELARTIARTVMPRLRDAELRTALRRRHDLGAYHLMLLGQREMFRLERASFDGAGNMLRRAAALDPGFAAPHVALADWHSLRIGQRWSDDSAAEARALEEEVRLALELDGGHARALAVLGHNYTILYRDYDRAQELLDRAMDLAPNDAETCLWISPTLAYTGRAGEAVRSAERAIRLSPEAPLLFRYQHFLSIAHYAKGDWEEAAYWGLRSLRSNGDYTSNLAMTAAALAALGRTEEARPPAARLMQLRPDFRIGVAKPRWPYRDKHPAGAVRTAPHCCRSPAMRPRGGTPHLNRFWTPGPANRP